jgi:hypothetical protein
LIRCHGARTIIGLSVLEIPEVSKPKYDKKGRFLEAMFLFLET